MSRIIVHNVSSGLSLGFIEEGEVVLIVEVDEVTSTVIVNAEDFMKLEPPMFISGFEFEADLEKIASITYRATNLRRLG